MNTRRRSRNEHSPAPRLLRLLGVAALASACQPAADAGPDQTVINPPQTVQLDGSGSADPNGFGLGYLWSLDAKPAGSAATIAPEDAELPNPTFTADVGGTYTASLRVSNGLVPSEPDAVTVTVPTLNVASPASGTVIVGTEIPVSITFAGVVSASVHVELDGQNVTSSLGVTDGQIAGALPLADRQGLPAEGPHYVYVSAQTASGQTVQGASSFMVSDGSLPALIVPTTESVFLQRMSGSGLSPTADFMYMVDFAATLGWESEIANTVLYDLSRSSALRHQVLSGQRLWPLNAPLPTMTVADTELQFPRMVEVGVWNLRRPAGQYDYPRPIPFLLWTFNDDWFAYYPTGDTVYFVTRASNPGPDDLYFNVTEVPITTVISAIFGAELSEFEGVRWKNDEPPPPPQVSCNIECAQSLGVVIASAVAAYYAQPQIARNAAAIAAALGIDLNACSCALCNFFICNDPPYNYNGCPSCPPPPDYCGDTPLPVLPGERMCLP